MLLNNPSPPDSPDQETIPPIIAYTMNDGGQQPKNDLVFSLAYSIPPEK